MITRVEVKTRQGSLLNLPLDDITNGYAIEGIEGLGPVKATLVSSSFAGVDGAQYHSSKREPRNIKITIGLESDYDVNPVSVLRSRLYSYFMPKMEIILRFYMDTGLYVDIAGVVEDFDTPIFAKEPQVAISLMCFMPDFIDPNPVLVQGSTTSGTTENLIEYEGTVEAGILLKLAVNRTLTSFTVYHTPPDGTIRQMDFAAALSTGDVLAISTISGSKGATLTRANTDTSILYGISPESNWLELQNGVNGIRVFAAGAAIPYTIEYVPRYGGL